MLISKSCDYVNQLHCLLNQTLVNIIEVGYWTWFKYFVFVCEEKSCHRLFTLLSFYLSFSNTRQHFMKLLPVMWLRYLYRYYEDNRSTVYSVFNTCIDLKFPKKNWNFVTRLINFFSDQINVFNTLFLEYHLMVSDDRHPWTPKQSHVRCRPLRSE